jgi:hypothetical protein
MQKIINFVKRFGLSAFSFGLPVMAFAQTQIGGNPQPAGSGSNGASGIPNVQINSVQNVLDVTCVVFAWMFYFLIALAIIFVVIAAYRYLTSAGNPEKVKGATNTILYAAIAVGVALLAKSIPLIVASFLGANDLGLTTC